MKICRRRIAATALAVVGTAFAPVALALTTSSAVAGSVPSIVLKRTVQLQLTQDSTVTASGKQVTFTAVFGGTSYPPPPTGTIRFYDNGQAIGTVVVAAPSSSLGAHATLKTSSLKSGSHSVIAAYSGDSLYEIANSPAVKHTVQYKIDPCKISACPTSGATTTPAAGSQGKAAGDSGIGTDTGSAPSGGATATAIGGSPTANPRTTPSASADASAGSTSLASGEPTAGPTDDSHQGRNFVLAIAVVIVLLALAGLTRAMVMRRNRG